MNKLLLLATGLVCLSACGKAPHTAGKQSTIRDLDLHLNQNFKEAYDLAMESGAIDWSENCSYKYGFHQDTTEPQYKAGVRHLDLPNGMLIDLFYRSNQKLVMGSEAWNSASYQESVLSDIHVINSRVLRSQKAERTQQVSGFHQDPRGITRITGFIGDLDDHFLHVEMSAETAQRRITELGLIMVSPDQTALAKILADVNQQRQESGFKRLATLKPDTKWKTIDLKGDSSLFIQLENISSEDLVTAIIFTQQGGIRELHKVFDKNIQCVELELINVTNTVLTNLN